MEEIPGTRYQAAKRMCWKIWKFQMIPAYSAGRTHVIEF